MSVFSEGEGVSVAPSRRRQRFHRRRNRQTLRTKLVRRVAQAEPAVAAFAAAGHAAVVVEDEGAVLAGFHLVRKMNVLMTNVRPHPIEPLSYKLGCSIIVHSFPRCTKMVKLTKMRMDTKEFDRIVLRFIGERDN
jgi:hypothetical protein